MVGLAFREGDAGAMEGGRWAWWVKGRAASGGPFDAALHPEKGQAYSTPNRIQADEGIEVLLDTDVQLPHENELT